VEKPASSSARSRGAGRSGQHVEGLAREERVLVARQDDEQPARPRPPGGGAGGEPRAGEAERGVEAEPALELVLQPLGRSHRPEGVRGVRRQVDVRLVGRGPLDAPAGGEQQGGDLLADAGVGLEIAGPHDGLGAQVAGLAEGLACPHSQRARLAARGGHQAAARCTAADHQRPPAQGGVEAALDRDEERVEVDVQDRSPG
jgi:hypothetical protein